MRGWSLGRRGAWVAAHACACACSAPGPGPLSDHTQHTHASLWAGQEGAAAARVLLQCWLSARLRQVAGATRQRASTAAAAAMAARPRQRVAHVCVACRRVGAWHCWPAWRLLVGDAVNKRLSVPQEPPCGPAMMQGEGRGCSARCLSCAAIAPLCPARAAEIGALLPQRPCIASSPAGAASQWTACSGMLAVRRGAAPARDAAAQGLLCCACGTPATAARRNVPDARSSPAAPHTLPPSATHLTHLPPHHS